MAIEIDQTTQCPAQGVIDEQSCRDWIQKLQTQEFVERIRSRKVDCGQERPPFASGLIGAIHEAEEIAFRTGKVARVKKYIDENKKESVSFASLCNGSTPPMNQSNRPKLEIVAPDEPIMPPLEWGLLPKHLGIGVSRWFDECDDFIKKWSPRASAIQRKGCILWILSTIAARRIAVSYGGLQYTPLYIALVAPSSVYAKTSTTKIANEILFHAGLDWLLGPNRTTPERLITHMSGTRLPGGWEDLPVGQQELITKRLAHSGQLGWYYSEFGNLLREMADAKGRNAAFKSLLLCMDDGELAYENETQIRGNERVENPYLALLGTMTPDSMKPYSTSNDTSWGDGFYARFAFCCPPSHIKKTREMLKAERFPDDDKAYPTSLLKPLREWHERLIEPTCHITSTEDAKGNITHSIERGEYPLTIYRLGKGVKDALDDYGDALDVLAQEPDLKQFRSCYSRLRDKTLRIATLIASFENSQTIELSHLSFAQHLSEELRYSLHSLDMFLHENNAVSQRLVTEQGIIDYLASCGEPKKAVEIRSSSRKWKENYDPDEFRKIIDSMEKNGSIKRARKLSPDERASRYEVAK